MAKSAAAKTTKPTRKSTPSGPAWYPLLALAATALAFANSINNGFVNWDDDVNVLENPNLRVFDWPSIKGIFTTDVIGNYNPLSILSFALEQWIFGLKPTGTLEEMQHAAMVFHIDNLILHLVCVYFVYRILTGLGLTPLAALFGTLIFGIHPMRVESVAWITERKDVLFGAFFLAALHLYIRYLDGGRKSARLLSLILFLFVLSLLAKIQAVTLPLTMLAVDYLRRRPLNLKLALEKWPYFALSLAVGLLGVYMLSENKSLDDTTAYAFHERLMVGFTSYLVYLFKFLVPYEMSPLYPYEAKMPTIFYASPLGILAVGFLVWQWWKRDLRAYVFGIAVFTFNVMFLLQILAAGQGFLADRFTYIPYLGLIFMLAWFVQERMKQPRLGMVVQLLCAVWLMAMAGFTYNQNRIWKNGETLWTHVLKYYQDAQTPWNNRARYYRELATRLNREKGAPAAQEVKVLKEKALADYNQAIDLKPQANTYNSRGKLFFDEGRIKEALADYDRGIALDPSIAELYINRAAVHGMAGNLAKALEDVNKGIQLDPENANGYLNRSLVYVNTGRYAEAEADYTNYLRLEPGNVDIYYERGLVRNTLGKHPQALEDLNKAISLNGSVGLYYVERAKALEMTGRAAEAAADRQRAAELGVRMSR